MHSDQLPQPLLIRISRRELLDFLAQYQASFRATRKKESSHGVIKSLWNMTGLYQGPTDEQLIRRESAWFSTIEQIVQRNPDSGFLEAESLFRLFLLLRNWGTEKNLTEKGLVSELISKFDAPLKNSFWQLLCRLDEAELFRTLTHQGDVKTPEDTFFEVRYATVVADSKSSALTGEMLFKKFVSADKECLSHIEFFGNALIHAKQRGHWMPETFRKVFDRLIQCDQLWLSRFKEAWPHFSEALIDDPLFWQDCFKPEGIEKRLAACLPPSPVAAEPELKQVSPLFPEHSLPPAWRPLPTASYSLYMGFPSLLLNLRHLKTDNVAAPSPESEDPSLRPSQ